MKKYLLPTLALLSVIPVAAYADSTVSGPSVSSQSEPDYAGAKPFPLPQVKTLLPASAVAPAAAPGPAGTAPGGVGTGEMSPVRLAPAVSTDSSGVAPQQFGTFNHPFSTMRVPLFPQTTVPAQRPTEFSYPYRIAGKLFFQDGTSNFVCSASLIKRGVVVTAAHCVAAWGQRRFYSNFRFVPAYRNGLAPYGTWTGTPIIMNSYYLGTAANCTTAGVVCDNDIAVIRVTPQSGAYPGNATGWFGYGWNGWGFTATNPAKTHITQLGYPVALDSGQIMERNDSQGDRTSASANNTIIGSLMTGGSSGGPWTNNLGLQPALNGTTFGSYADPNMVVGVTSWGYISSLPKEQGASPFTSNNIVPLVNAACGSPVTNPGCL